MDKASISAISEKVLERLKLGHCFEEVVILVGKKPEQWIGLGVSVDDLKLVALYALKCAEMGK